MRRNETTIDINEDEIAAIASGDNVAADGGAVIGYVSDATEAVANAVLASAEGDGDGRSGWKWVRLIDGTLMLAIFPRGGTYEIAALDEQGRLNP